MLRLLLLYPLVASIMAPLPVDDEPKPATVEVMLNQNGEVVKEDVKGPPTASSFVYYYPQNYATTNYADTVFTIDLNPDSDLKLAAPDDALRAQLKLPRGRGLVATSVRVHGPAWEAGVRENDILMTLDDVYLDKPEDLEQKLKQAGDKRLTLSLLRKGMTVDLNVQPEVRITLGPVPSETTTFWIGVNVTALEPALRAQLDIPDHQGLVVTAVTDGSPAAKSDLKVNDVILTVAGTLQMDQGGLSEVVQKNGDKPLAIEYLRERMRHTTQITPEKKATKLRVTRVREPFLGATVMRPGVVQNDQLHPNLARQGLFWSNNLKSTAPGQGLGVRSLSTTAQAPSAPDKRIDEMASEIKELRQAIDGLRKALEDRK
ncbi:MAG: PDZ domain-containing protein [Paludisphaera borealis]|uniref:PDZ domain-containing protein n=1 Tax=Paludisphaera borealis TaxID=1387353 RepID=UPI00283C93F7|nr:PDZ domain-containing protein [Paludisphaera borealis]MDR3621259.1 PDZ domain-containing protein [Paludisphaera borealis]